MGGCTKVGLIYQIECMTCQSTYIGEIGRLLNVRINEHLAGKRRENVGTPLVKHWKEDHCGADFDVKCTILAFETVISPRKALEACFSEKAQNK